MISINLNEKDEKKFKINMENIGRNNKKRQQEKTQVILLQKKRKLENTDKNDLIKKKKLDEIVNKINILEINQENPTINEISKTEGFDNILSKHKKYSKKNYISSSNEDNDIYLNYYPTQISPHIEKKIIENLVHSFIDSNLENYSKCKKMKLMEKRKMLDNKMLKNQFSDIKHSFSKIFGDANIIKTNNNYDKFIIINNNERFTNNEINNIIKNDDYDIKIFEVDNHKINYDLSVDDYIKILYSEENLIDEIENLSDDNDSNCENNPRNDYPDEEDSEIDDNREYDIYNPYMNILRNAEKRLNNNYDSDSSDVNIYD